MREQVAVGKGLVSSLWDKIDNVSANVGTKTHSECGNGVSGSEILGVWVVGVASGDEHTIFSGGPNTEIDLLISTFPRLPGYQI